MYTHICKIVEVIPYQKLSYSWTYKDYEGDSLVTFELFSEEEKTRLKLTHEGLETFPQNNPSFTKESFAGAVTDIRHLMAVCCHYLSSLCSKYY